jgi:phosphohistidine swiveling domain-containing protein
MIIEHIDKYSTHITPEVYGGKANSLHRLISKNFRVPEAWAIACSHTFSRPNLEEELVFMPDVKFAVRSGAPVSMPGLLQTKLNVSRDDLQSAINAVWDSWHTDHARAYRENKGLSHDMGTGVIIQRMVNKPSYSGVAFTVDPNNVLGDKTTFDALVECVPGLGEDLVGGKVTPERIYRDSYIWASNLWDFLIYAHDNFGASDLEWCVGKNAWGDEVVYFVQQRPIKFPDKPAVESMSKGEVLIKGSSIGAPRQVTAKIVYDPAQAAGNILYNENFPPELYMAMVQAAGIITREGGKTCHAGIIARDLGKPAVGGIGSLYSLIGKVVTLDGIDGCIRKASEDDVDAKVVRITPRRVASRKPDFSLANGDRTFNACELLLRVYGNVEREAKGEITRARLNEIVGEVAQVFSVYLYQSVVGEARHALRQVHLQDAGLTEPTKPVLTCQCADHTKVFKADMLYYETQLAKYKAAMKGIKKTERRTFRGVLGRLAQLGVVVPKNPPDRDNFIKDVPPPSSLDHAIAVTKLCYVLLNNYKWGRSYGGKKWANICGILLNYLKGLTSDLLFVDAVFNLTHNTGSVFGKYGYMYADNGCLQKQLDAKRKGNIDRVKSVLKDYHYVADAGYAEVVVKAPTLFGDAFCNISLADIESKQATAAA